MKKTILWTITTIAILTLLVIGAGVEQTTGSMIAAAAALAWLGLMSAANVRRRNK